MQGIVETEKLFFKVITMTSEKEDVEDQDLEEPLKKMRFARLIVKCVCGLKLCVISRLKFDFLFIFGSSH